MAAIADCYHVTPSEPTLCNSARRSLKLQDRTLTDDAEADLLPTFLGDISDKNIETTSTMSVCTTLSSANFALRSNQLRRRYAHILIGRIQITTPKSQERQNRSVTFGFAGLDIAGLKNVQLTRSLTGRFVPVHFGVAVGCQRSPGRGHLNNLVGYMYRYAAVT